MGSIIRIEKRLPARDRLQYRHGGPLVQFEGRVVGPLDVSIVHEESEVRPEPFLRVEEVRLERGVCLDESVETHPDGVGPDRNRAFPVGESSEQARDPDEDAHLSRSPQH